MTGDCRLPILRSLRSSLALQWDNTTLLFELDVRETQVCSGSFGPPTFGSPASGSPAFGSPQC